MAREKKKPDLKKSTEIHKNKEIEKSDNDFDEIDLGDADGSSGNLGMDNFKLKGNKDQFPSNRGRIEEL